MKYYFQRLNSEDVPCVYTGSLFIDADQQFRFYFDNHTKDIRLNDGNTHCTDRLYGVVTQLWIDDGGIHLHCFLEINGKWHKDILHFRYNKSTGD